MTKMMLKSLRDMPGGETRIPSIILNKTHGGKSFDISEKDACELLDIQSVINLPYDNALFAKAENSGEALSAQPNFNKYSPMLINYIGQISDLVHFKSDMKQKMNTGLFSFFNKIKGDK